MKEHNNLLGNFTLDYTEHEKMRPVQITLIELLLVALIFEHGVIPAEPSRYIFMGRYCRILNKPKHFIRTGFAEVQSIGFLIHEVCSV